MNYKKTDKTRSSYPAQLLNEEEIQWSVVWDCRSSSRGTPKKNDHRKFYSSPFPGGMYYRINFANGSLHDDLAHFDANNRKIKEEHFKDGKKHGPQMCWDEMGYLKYEIYYIDGVKQTEEK